jgi:outer membrane protein assembly factor BamD
MSIFALRRFTLGLLLLTFAFVLPGRSAADLVWTPQTGWKVEGGVLAGFNGADAQNALDLRTAIKYYTRVSKKYPNSVYAPEALYRTGKIRLERQQYVKSFDAFQQVVSKYSNTSRFNEIIGEQYRIASALLDGARTRIWGIFPGFTNREKAIEEFEVILINAPYSDYAPLALMNIARGHQKLGNTEEAIDALDRMINTYPESLLTPDAYVKLAQTHASLVEGAFYDQTSTRDAVTYYEDFIIRFPNDANVATAEKGLADMKKVLAESKMKMADFYFYKRDNYKAARVFYNEAITVYPDSSVAAQARERLAEVEAAAAKAAEGAPKKRWFFF